MFIVLKCRKQEGLRIQTRNESFFEPNKENLDFINY